MPIIELYMKNWNRETSGFFEPMPLHPERPQAESLELSFFSPDNPRSQKLRGSKTNKSRHLSWCPRPRHGLQPLPQTFGSCRRRPEVVPHLKLN